jgi:sulfoxide reductase catalytic subunit YedY
MARTCPGQNGAPIRLVVPWKYGFKSIKSDRADFAGGQHAADHLEHAAAAEYGFYANVNPTVDHPRWSQARAARRRGSFAGREGHADVQRL